MSGGGFEEKVAGIRDCIARAAERAGRHPDGVTLIAVSKTHPAEVVERVVRAGVGELGENRVQEAAAKRPHVSNARWHLIGPLQRNKARLALETFDVIHTIDRPEIGDRLQFLLAKHWPGRTIDVLLEINVGDEHQKAGVRPDEAVELLDNIRRHRGLRVCGLMAIPPYDVDPEASRPYFIALRRLRDRLEQDVGVALPELSMGMSHDFEIAVEEGATMVRVGTAIFGPRGG